MDYGDKLAAAKRSLFTPPRWSLFTPPLTISLSAEEEHAIRRVAAGAGDEALEALVLEVMKRARQNRVWLGCDCRSEDGRRPAVAPCRNHRGTDYWRVLAGRHVPHAEGCVFHRTQARRRHEAVWNRPPVTAPDGFFAVLRDRAEERRVSQTGGRFEEEGERTGVRRPALLQHLLMLMDRTKLNRLPQADTFGDPNRWLDAMRERATEIEIAPGRALSDLWFPHIRMWKGNWVHARVREAAKGWPAGHKPQGFLCWVVWDVDAHGVGTQQKKDRVEVVTFRWQPTSTPWKRSREGCCWNSTDAEFGRPLQPCGNVWTAPGAAWQGG